MTYQKQVLKIRVQASESRFVVFEDTRGGGGCSCDLDLESSLGLGPPPDVRLRPKP